MEIMTQNGTTRTVLIYSIDDIKSEYEKSNSGHWFDARTMRFFGTRLTNSFRKLDEYNYLFVTTERDPSGKRAASLRHAEIIPDLTRFVGFRIKINTVGDFHSMSLYQAKKLMSQYEMKAAA